MMVIMLFIELIKFAPRTIFGSGKIEEPRNGISEGESVWEKNVKC